jgi:MFS family permease
MSWWSERKEGSASHQHGGIPSLRHCRSYRGGGRNRFLRGFSSLSIGLVIAAGLAGASVATPIVSLRADLLGRGIILLLLALLCSIAGIALAVTPNLPLLAFAVVSECLM